MNKNKINIGIIEPSDIIFEGISLILNRSELNLRILRISDPDEINDNFYSKEQVNIIIANPLTVQNRIKDLKKLKRSFSKIYWIAIIYMIFENELLAFFDETIYINDSYDAIYKNLEKIINDNFTENTIIPQEQLSQREIDVLVQLVNGLSNKEIAEKLNISTHTVISHRKNITIKTGIKSQSGLTIYAITKNIISLDKLA